MVEMTSLKILKEIIASQGSERNGQILQLPSYELFDAGASYSFDLELTTL